ncbi:hypothetical protein WA588_005051 [Blastocystis sp. NMH]
MDPLVLSLGIAFILILYIVVRCYKENGVVSEDPVKTMVVLGSGGHTSEMISLVRGLDAGHYTPLVFVYAESDAKSPLHLQESHLECPYSTRTIPRSREVGQSYFSAVFTTLHALIKSFQLVLEESPSVLIINGPGTCVPVAFAVVLFRVLNVLRCRIVFIESFCRVQTLSLTGKLLYLFADDFIVQWRHLAEKYPRARYLGILM